MNYKAMAGLMVLVFLLAILYFEWTSYRNFHYGNQRAFCEALVGSTGTGTPSGASLMMVGQGSSYYEVGRKLRDAFDSTCR